MNRIHRSIWNDKTGTFVAASEHVQSNGKQSSHGAAPNGRGLAFALKSLAASLMLAFGSNVYALPVGGAVSAGSAAIANSAGKTTINQSSQNVAINWQSFNIGQGEAVQFVQPNSSSVALNRVLGSDGSSILGSLSANGKVFLVNPNGILFGQGAQVNVGGLVASTLNITDGDFMAGLYKFAGTGNGSVVNRGSIDAAGGHVALLGANVSNEGVITATLGTVALAAGNAMTLDMAGDGLLNVAVSQGAVNALAANGGLIRADGGQVLLTAQSAGNLLQSAVNNTGVIQAQSIENRNGTIRLVGDMQSGTVNLSGALDASGTGSGQTGGSVIVTGHHVGLTGVNINASGDAGGGTVLVGGDYQGRSLDVANATATYMSADSSISANAITQGNGGKVILWGNDATRAYGSLSARGGAQGGDGGLIETSGRWLDVAGITVDANAPQGHNGTWLLDPNNITIQAAGAETNVTPGPNFTSTNDNAIITTATIQTALNAGTNVTVTTAAAGTNAQAGDITVASTLTYTAVGGPILTLNALGDVNVNATVTPTTGSFVVNAGGNINVASTVTATTGNVSYRAVGNVNITADTTITTGNITAVAGGNVAVANPMTVTTGDIILRGDNDGTGPGAVIGGTVAITCAINCITITTGNLRVRFNPVTYATTAAEIANYGTKLTGGGILDAKAWVFGRGDNKVYDGTTTATVSGLKPDIGGIAPAAVIGAVSNANFDTKHVGVNKLITYDSTFANATFDLFAPLGTAPGTYTTRADITVRPLTVSAVTDTRVYNGTTSSVGVPTSAGLQVGDALNGALTQAYVSRNVMGVLGSTLVTTGGPYTVTDGNGGNNYLVTVNTAPGTITAAPLTVTAVTDTRVYNGTTSSVGVPTVAGLQGGGDTLTGPLTQAFNSKNVMGVLGSTLTPTGPYAAADGNGGLNYAVTVNTAPGTITQAALVGSITAADKLFDGNDTATITSRTLAGIIGADAVTYTGGTATFNNPNPGVGKPVTGITLALAGVDAINYTVNSTALTQATITALPEVPIVVPGVGPGVTSPGVTSPGTSSDALLGFIGVNPLAPSLAGLNLSVLGTGVAVPNTQLAQIQPAPRPAPVRQAPPAYQPPPVEPPPQVFAPIEAPPAVYVPPQRPRRTDRN